MNFFHLWALWAGKFRRGPNLVNTPSKSVLQQLSTDLLLFKPLSNVEPLVKPIGNGKTIFLSWDSRR